MNFFLEILIKSKNFTLFMNHNIPKIIRVMESSYPMSQILSMTQYICSVSRWESFIDYIMNEYKKRK
jgi:hypothetical protein